MKITHYKKQLIFILHLMFWMISVNAWNIVFNPGVESVSPIKGLSDDWPLILLINSLFFLYCLLPFAWLLKRKGKWIKIAASILFLVPILYLVFEWLQPPSERKDISLFTDFFISGFMYTAVFHLTIAAAVYYNLKVLIPRYLTLSKFGIYILSFILLTCISAIVNFALFNYGIDKVFPSLYFISYFNTWELICIIGVYLLFTSLIFLVWQYAEMLIANREKAQHELSALKAQINPHFLFNNLNTIYSLASTNDVHTKDVILQLSDFLRYVLYDTNSESIPLEKEVEIIRTYVELQKKRVDPSIIKVILTTEGTFENANISPLLLLPLAENCFKHGIGKEPGSIRIHIGFNSKQLLFTTENTIAVREKNGEEENGGIGIKNVEKRLNLLYAGRHTLHFEETAGIFRLEMKISLLK